MTKTIMILALATALILGSMGIATFTLGVPNASGVSSPASPSSIFMEIPGIVGPDTTPDGMAGVIEVLAYSHDISTSFKEKTGVLKGRNQHTPVAITKQLDKASPFLFESCTQGETHDTVKFSFYRVETDMEEKYFTILLEDAQIASCAHGINPGGTEPIPAEEYSFVYSKITWTFTEGTLEHTDDWIAER